MKKTVLLLLSLILCLNAFVACGSGDNVTDGGNKGNDDENTENSEKQDAVYVRVNEMGAPDAEGEYILFGEYPQSLKESDVSVTEATDVRGYYLGSDGAYYAKVTASPCEDGYAFGTGEAVMSEGTYYFKVEPVRWRILSEQGDTALLLCDSIVANKAFDDDSNNYADSEIRTWLNGEFYNAAFDVSEKAIIATVSVNNSAQTTGDPSDTAWTENENVCEDTDDKLFLPSYEDVTNTAYGFSSGEGEYDAARRWSVSDHALATGARMKMIDTFDANGFCWLRSPYYALGSHARIVDGYGVIYIGSNVSGAHIGVVPAMQIRLK